MCFSPFQTPCALGAQPLGRGHNYRTGPDASPPTEGGPPAADSFLGILRMSIDKYVLRGFTSSTGGGVAGWVATAPQGQQQPQQPARNAGDTGTSFVMGGAGGGGRTASKSSARPSARESYGFGVKEREIRDSGTRGTGELPKQCFGSRRDQGGAQAKDYSGTLIPAAFVALAFLGIAYVLINSLGLIPKPISREHRATSEADVYRRRQPSW